MKCSLGISNFLKISLVFPTLFSSISLHQSLRKAFLSLLAILWNSVFRFWIFTGRTDAEAEAPILWPPDVKSWLTGKDSDAGRVWGREEKGTTQDEMGGWHRRLDGRDSECTPGVGDGQGGLVCCDSWGHKQSDTTEWLNWTELNPFRWVYFSLSSCLSLLFILSYL